MCVCVCLCEGGCCEGIHSSVHYLDMFGGGKDKKVNTRDLENGWPRFAAHSGLSSVFPAECHMPHAL